MYKIIMIIAIFLCCSFIGFSFGDRFKKRLEDLKEVYRALILLQNEILYNNTPLSESFQIIRYKLKEPFNSILKELSEGMNNINTFDIGEELKKIYKNKENELYLNDDDKSIISQFAVSLGQTGVYGQENIFKLTLENLKGNISEAKELSKKNTKLYRYLGMCFGAMIAIVLI